MFFISIVLALLKGGLVTRLALEKSLETIDSADNMLALEFNYWIKENTSTMDLSTCINCLINYIDSGPIQNNLRILALYIESGAEELLHLLQIQADDLWLYTHRLEKEEIERNSVFLFVPMALNLLAIIALVMALVIAQMLGANF